MTVLVRDATVQTMSVDIQTLRVSGRQMTLAVYDQLPDVSRDDARLGQPWGWVNRHDRRRDSDCGSWRHRHVVIQLNGELGVARLSEPTHIGMTDQDALAMWRAETIVDYRGGHRPANWSEAELADALTWHRYWRDVIAPLPQLFVGA